MRPLILTHSSVSGCQEFRLLGFGVLDCLKGRLEGWPLGRGNSMDKSEEEIPKRLTQACNHLPSGKTTHTIMNLPHATIVLFWVLGGGGRVTSRGAEFCRSGIKLFPASQGLAFLWPALSTPFSGNACSGSGTVPVLLNSCVIVCRAYRVLSSAVLTSLFWFLLCVNQKHGPVMNPGNPESFLNSLRFLFLDCYNLSPQPKTGP